MKCIACGREMLERGTHYECSNILCDYEEAIEPEQRRIKLEQEYLHYLYPNKFLRAHRCPGKLRPIPAKR